MRGPRGMMLPGVLASLLMAAMALPAGSIAAETRLSESVVITEAVDGDLYAMGGEVRIDGAVAGAIAVAAGDAAIAGDIESDAMLAAGRIDLSGGVGDDLRAAGGYLAITGFITDQATIAAGTVTIGPESAIGGRTWIAAGDVEIAGQIGENLRLAAGQAVISGRVAGNVEVAAREIRIESGAVIGGDLIWRSGQEPFIAEDAQIFGEVRRAGVGQTPDFSGAASPRIAGGWALGFTLVVAALILLWFAPDLITRSAAAFSAAPVRTLLLGAASFVLTPVLAFILLVTVLGWILGLVVMTGYVFGLMLSGLVGLLIVVQLVRTRFGVGSAAWKSLLLVVLVVASLIVAQQVPTLGGLLAFLVMLGGFGALTAILTGRGPATR